MPSADDVLRALTSHTPYGIFYSSADGGCEYVNERWCELTGLGFEAALGDGWIAALHPDDVARVIAEWTAASEEGRDSIVEYRFLRPDGTVSWIEGFATPVRDGADRVIGWVGTCLDLTTRKQTEAALLVASEHDALTNLGNRRKLLRDLELAFAPGGTAGSHLLVIFDLNGFKSYNDTFGHPAGDAMLAQLGGRLASVTAGHAYRMGGDEFCVLSAVAPGEAGALLTRAAGALTDSGEGYSVSSSSGAVFLPEEAATPAAALSLADQRLYAHKHQAHARLSRRRLGRRELLERARTLLAPR